MGLVREEPVSVLLRARTSALALSAAFRTLLPLPDLRISGSSAVSGGLGGVRLFEGSDRLRRSFSAASSSVASGVSGVEDDLPTSSLLRTASRLCALLKVGYDDLGRTSDAAPPLVRRSVSGSTMVTFREPRSDRVVDVKSSSLSLSLSLSRSRSRSFSRTRSGSRSRSRSRSLLADRRLLEPDDFLLLVPNEEVDLWWEERCLSRDDEAPAAVPSRSRSRSRSYSFRRRRGFSSSMVVSSLSTGLVSGRALSYGFG